MQTIPGGVISWYVDSVVVSFFFIVTKSCKYRGVCLFIILKTYIAIKHNLLNLSEGNCDFSSKFS